MRRSLPLLTVTLVALVLAPAARSQSPVAPPAPRRPVPAPVEAKLALKVERIGGPRATTLTGSSVRVRGTTTAFVAGQTVTVRFFERGRKRGAKRVELRPGPAGTGIFMLSYKPVAPGPLSIRAAHDPTPQLGGLAARARTVDVLPRRVAAAQRTRLDPRPAAPPAPPGLRHRSARRLRRAHEPRGARVSQGDRHGAHDERLGAVMRALARGKGTFKIRHPEHGRHIEGDLSRQVIALIDKGKVQRIYPTSSGAPSTPTVIGSFRVYLKTPGTNAKGMVDSAYFIRGYATHGYYTVPVYPASHGCLRLPIPDARSVFNWIDIGTPVDVYR